MEIENQEEDLETREDMEEDLLAESEEEVDLPEEEVPDEETLLNNESVEIHLPSGFICKLSSNRYDVYDLGNLMLSLHKEFNNGNKKKGKPTYT